LKEIARFLQLPAQQYPLRFSGRAFGGRDDNPSGFFRGERLLNGRNNVGVNVLVERDEYIRLMHVPLYRNVFEGLYLGMGEYDVSCTDVRDRNKGTDIIIRL